MLRILAIVLLVGNALLLAAQFGLFDRLMGSSQVPQREPERLQRQIDPQALRILAPQAASAALAAATASVVQAAAAASQARAQACLEAGPFNPAETEAAERTLRDAGLPPGSWQALTTEDSGSFMVYMGRYADRDTLQRKLDELKRLKLDAEELRGTAALQPGISLGRFDQRADADAALARMAQRGVRTARVLTLRQAQSQTLLRLPAADAATQARLAGLSMPSGPGFAACAGLPVTQAAAPAATASAAGPASRPGSGPAPDKASGAEPAAAPAPKSSVSARIAASAPARGASAARLASDRP